MTEAQKALEQLDKGALSSKKFRALIFGLVLMAAVGLFAIVYRADASLVGAILYPIALLAGGYVGATAWQDRTVRTAAVTGASAPRLAPDTAPGRTS